MGNFRNRVHWCRFVVEIFAMTEEQQLKLQAFLDGELPEGEAREVAALVARDADARDLLAEVRNTRQALANFEPALKLPESREFYWSKIQREIGRLEPVEAPAQSVFWYALVRRVVVPLGALAVLAIAGVFAYRELSPAPASASQSGQLKAMLADAGAFTFRNQSEGVTVVWLPYPAEKTVAENGAGDTLPAK